MLLERVLTYKTSLTVAVSFVAFDFFSFVFSTVIGFSTVAFGVVSAESAKYFE